MALSFPDSFPVSCGDLDANPLLTGNQAFVLLDKGPSSHNQAGIVWFSQNNLSISTDAHSAAEFEIEGGCCCPDCS